MELVVTKIPTNRLIITKLKILPWKTHNNNNASNEDKTKARIGSKTVEKEESDYKETTLTNKR